MPARRARLAELLDRLSPQADSDTLALRDAVFAAWEVAEAAEAFARTRDGVTMLDFEAARHRFREAVARMG